MKTPFAKMTRSQRKFWNGIEKREEAAKQAAAIKRNNKLSKKQQTP